MPPSLSYISFETGALLEKIQLPKRLHQLNISHIDVNEKNNVAIALQYQGGKTKVRLALLFIPEAALNIAASYQSSF